jgi:hypothetical protein
MARLSRPLYNRVSAALFFCVLFLFPRAAGACTTAVISGRATLDGRPILWKNRDSENKHNQVVFRDDGKYPYVGIVNQGDLGGLQIWAGVNVKGFAIMNAASYNLKGGADTEGEGRFMKLALQSCASVQDFQSLLEKTGFVKRDVSANFGVIDATGGAAYFEVGPKGYRRFNASDPAIAPRGYIVRTNYSRSGDRGKGTGFLREERAVALIEKAIEDKALNPRSLLSGVCRDLANERLGSFPEKHRFHRPRWAYTGDSICRFDTASTFVLSGVRPGDDPLLSTAWVILGEPVTGAAVPVWVGAGGVPVELAAAKGPAPLNVACDRIRDVLYPDRRGDMSKYIDVQALLGQKKKVLSSLLGIEADNFRTVDAALAEWGRTAPPADTMTGLQNRIAKHTLDEIDGLGEAGTAR